MKRKLTTLIQRKALAYVLTPDAPLVGVEVVAAVANVFDKAQWQPFVGYEHKACGRPLRQRDGFASKISERCAKVDVDDGVGRCVEHCR